MTNTIADFEINPRIHLTEDEQALLVYLSNQQYRPSSADLKALGWNFDPPLLGNAVAKFRRQQNKFRKGWELSKRETDEMLLILGRSGYLYVDYGNHAYNNPAYSIRTTQDQKDAELITVSVAGGTILVTEKVLARADEICKLSGGEVGNNADDIWVKALAQAQLEVGVGESSD